MAEANIRPKAGKTKTTNVPEVGSEVEDLPRPKTNQQSSGSNAKGPNTGVGALVGITELLLTVAKVFHLLDDLADKLLNSTELGLYRLQLLVGLDGCPVLSIGANINIEFDIAG